MGVIGRGCLTWCSALIGVATSSQKSILSIEVYQERALLVRIDLVFRLETLR